MGMIDSAYFVSIYMPLDFYSQMGKTSYDQNFPTHNRLAVVLCDTASATLFLTHG